MAFKVHEELIGFKCKRCGLTWTESTLCQCRELSARAWAEAIVEDVERDARVRYPDGHAHAHGYRAGFTISYLESRLADALAALETYDHVQRLNRKAAQR